MSGYDRQDLVGILAAGDHISTDGYLRSSAAIEGAVYVKRDFLFRSGTWRGADVARVFPGSIPHTLVVGHSDIPTTGAVARLLSLFGMKKLLGTNVVELSGVSTPLPLGLTNNCDDSPRHRILGSTQPLIEVLTKGLPPERKRDKILLSFNESTSPRHRAQLLRSLRGKPDVTHVDVNYSAQGRLAYLEAISSHEFVLCPRGNGIDTHRFWETLYCRSTPVVKRGQMIDSLLKQYPAWIVDDWNEVLDPARRSAARQRLSGEVWDISKLTQTYWNNFIRTFTN